MNTTVVRFRDGTYGVRCEAGGFYMYYNFGSEGKWIELGDKYMYNCTSNYEEALDVFQMLEQIDKGTPI